jgi:uncharacterized protein (TIGR02145 family)
MKDKLMIAIVILGMITACNKDDVDPNDTNSDGTGTGTPAEIIDGDGNVYESVTIGDQVWLNKNMMSTTFMNGTSIPSTTPYNVNLGITTKAVPTQWPAYYDESKVATLGRIYTAAVAISNLKICPNGYRVPTLSDFEILEANAGVGAIGLKVPNEFGTSPLYEGDNSLGFNGIPVARRLYSGNIMDHLYYLGLWTNTLHSSNNDADGDGVGDGLNAYYRSQLSEYGLSTVGASSEHYQGYCIRCIEE